MVSKAKLLKKIKKLEVEVTVQKSLLNDEITTLNYIIGWLLIQLINENPVTYPQFVDFLNQLENSNPDSMGVPDIEFLYDYVRYFVSNSEHV